MNVRELIHNLENEKLQLEEENKLLKKENKELKKINEKLVDELNSYKDHNIENVVDKVEDTLSAIAENVIASAVEPEDEQKRGTSIDEIESEDIKPKRSSRKKKSDVDEVVSLM